MDGASWTYYTADGDVSKTGFVLRLLRENICISRIDLFLHLKMTSINCPFGDFCYKPFGDKKTWHSARSVCRSLGAELVSIHSMKEQSWVESYLYMATSDVWTGLNDLAVPGMFMWSNEHIVTFTYWAPGEPNNHDGFTEDCVEMSHQVRTPLCIHATSR
uniref:C-type lectin domain-containing protein n=1 Tax=Poecilia mexicana TaxID=48701 RepID=A0A3B3XQA3_9TELE